jgi:hypothetical protein
MLQWMYGLDHHRFGRLKELTFNYHQSTPHAEHI